MTSRYPARAEVVFALLAERKAAAIDVPVIQPADPFLDTAGEDLRRRIFMTESETGASLCLRPEFTIPVCLHHIASESGTPRRYGYLGEVFRQRREGGNEFFQCGIEDLGDSDERAADARAIGDASALLTMLLPGAKLQTTLGDQGVFEAVLAALGLPRGWQKRLLRAFGDPAQIDVALNDLSGGGKRLGLERDAAALAQAGDEDALVVLIETKMTEIGMAPSAGRAAREIARRLIEKAGLGAVRLSDDALEALRRFLAIRAPLDGASAALGAFAEESGLMIGDALEAFTARVDAIRTEELDPAAIHYNAAFGRRLDYYTGLVFEIAAGDGAVLAGGGRYDRLLTLLGAADPIPGVGFSIWLDRVAVEGARR